MSRIYASEGSEIQPAELSKDDLAAIGRLIRAIAEIEYTVSLYIGAHCDLNGSNLVILLGRSPISKKLEMGGYFARVRGEKSWDEWKKVFNEDFSEMLKCRNTVAHGVFLGLDKDGLYSFLTTDTDQPEQGQTIQMVAGYHPTFLDNISVKAERYSLIVTDALRLGTSREKSLQRELRPHRKAQPKRPPSGRHPSQPQSSKK